MATRIDRLFGRLRTYASARLPWLGRLEARHCRECDRDHKRKWRQFAHAGHRPMTVCFAADAEHEMTDLEILGMGAHEIGHIIGDKIGLPRHRRATGAGKTPLSVQDEADKAVLQMLGLVIQYNDRTLQQLVDPPPEFLDANPPEIVFTRRPDARHANYVLVQVDPALVDVDWAKDPTMYIGRGGSGAAISTRYQDFGTWLKLGRAVEPSVLWAQQTGLGTVAYFSDGRHRFAYLRDLGLASIPVAVHPSNVKMVRARWGTRQVRRPR